jgi:hypothetical protein
MARGHLRAVDRFGIGKTPRTAHRQDLAAAGRCRPLSCQPPLIRVLTADNEPSRLALGNLAKKPETNLACAIEGLGISIAGMPNFVVDRDSAIPGVAE